MCGTESPEPPGKRDLVHDAGGGFSSAIAALQRPGRHCDRHAGCRAEPFGARRLERLICVNTLVLRADLSGNPSFRELLAQVRDVTLGAYAHQDLPFEKLVEALNLQRDFSRNPLFQVLFILQSIPDDILQLNEIAPGLLKVNTGTAQFDLTLELSETPHGLEGMVGYATDLFEAATITRLIGHFQTLLEGIIAPPRGTPVRIAPAD